MLQVFAAWVLRLEWMKQFGWNVAGVEVSRAALERADKFALNVFRGELSDARL